MRNCIAVLNPGSFFARGLSVNTKS